MANYISETEFDKVVNFFGGMHVRRAAGGGTSIVISPINKAMNDSRENTVEYRLYKYNNIGFQWRRIITNMFEGPRPYQLFRYGINYKTHNGWRYAEDYVYPAFSTVEEALERFDKYIKSQKMEA